MGYLCNIHYSPLTIHQKYIQRCLELAKKGAGYVAPNPMVGAVLVNDGQIIGEGWHRQYGGPHAEVNCIGQAIQNGQTDKLNPSTLYVSLEPCAHHGKTPPCTDLIIQHKIKKVVIGCRDPFKEVDGKGIEKLEVAGVEVELVSGEMENACKEINKRFITFHTLHRPYVILKWAQTADGFFSTSPKPSPKVRTSGDTESSRLLISNEYSNRLVHKWRSEEASILVGTNTAMLDDPELTTRLWSGPSPVRLVVDMNLRLLSSLKIFNDTSPTIIFNTKIHSKESGSATPSPFMERAGVRYYQVTNDASLVHQIVDALYQLNIQSVLVEGGAKLLQSFIDERIWDEARVISNKQLAIGNGLPDPQLQHAVKIDEQTIFSDTIEIYKPGGGDS